MRTITLHPASLALGLVLGGIALLTMSQAIVANSPLRIEYAPHPRDMVQIREGVPYTVPPGRVLVLTGLGDASPAACSASLDVRLQVNGQVECRGFGNSGNPFPSSTVLSIPVGLTTRAGDVVEVVTGMCLGVPPTTHARAWGYLAPQ